MALRIIHMAYAGFDGCPGCVSRHTATKSYDLSQREAAAEEEGPWYHGTRTEFQPGDVLTPQGKKARNNKDPNSGHHVYFTRSFSAAAWAADYAKEPHPGAPGRIYEVRPSGPYEDDPTLLSESGTNPTGSYRTRHPVHVVREMSPDDFEYDPASKKMVRKAVKGYDLSPRSGMIYLDLPPGLIRRVPGGIDDEHITLVYLGKDVSDEAFAEACRRAQEAAAQHHPMEGVLHGIETFEPSDSSGNKVPAFVPAYVPGIGKLRQGLEDLSASEHRQYRPHVTLAYLEPGDELPEPHPSVPVRFTHLHVKRGDDVASFPLGGGMRREAGSNPEFFHGTDAKMSPGDLIMPGRPKTNAGSDPRHVYFTEKYEHAEGAARGAASRHATSYDKELRQWVHAEPEPYYVYQVEPTGEWGQDEQLPWTPFSHQSAHPLRVVRDATKRDDDVSPE